jgi:hypothetical protein
MKKPLSGLNPTLPSNADIEKALDEANDEDNSEDN